MKSFNNAESPSHDLNECSVECLLKLSNLLFQIPCTAIALHVEEEKWSYFGVGDQPVEKIAVEEIFEEIIASEGELESEHYFGVKLDLKILNKLGLLIFIKQPDRNFSDLEKELIGFFKNYLENELSIQTIENLFNEHGEMLIQKARLESLGQMATEIVHEINTPIAVIHARLEMLLRQTKSASISKDEVLDSLNKIIENTIRVEQMIKDIKIFSRFSEQDPLVKVEVSEVLDYSLVFCMDRIRNASVQLILSPVNLDLKVSCRKVQLSQVLINLVSNSVDAVRDMKGAWIKINVLPTSEKIEIHVIDSGNGIEPPVLKKLFQPFHTTKEAGKGTGLGLCISKNILASHQGELRYQLNNGNTSFVMELPLVN